MKKEDIPSILRRHFPSLNNPELSDTISEKAVFLTIPAGKILMSDDGGMVMWKLDKREVSIMLAWDKEKNNSSVVVTYK